MKEYQVHNIRIGQSAPQLEKSLNQAAKDEGWTVKAIASDGEGYGTLILEREI